MGALGQPKEFDPAAAGLDDAPDPTPRRGRKVQVDDGITISPTPPRMTVTVPGPGNKPVQISAVDKSAAFHVEPSELLVRFGSIAVRPVSGKVFCYDKQGVLLARFDSMKQADRVFEEAGLSEKVKDALALRERVNKAAAEKLALAKASK